MPTQLATDPQIAFHEAVIEDDDLAAMLDERAQLIGEVADMVRVKQKRIRVLSNEAKARVEKREDMTPGVYRLRKHKITVKQQRAEDVSFTKKEKVVIRFGTFGE